MRLVVPILQKWLGKEQAFYPLTPPQARATVAESRTLSLTVSFGYWVSHVLALVHF